MIHLNRRGGAIGGIQEIIFHSIFLIFFQAWSSGRIQHLPMFFTTTPTAPMESGIPYHRQMQQNVNENSFPSYLSTSHLLNNSLNAVTDFEPQLFSSPSV